MAMWGRSLFEVESDILIGTQTVEEAIEGEVIKESEVIIEELKRCNNAG